MNDDVLAELKKMNKLLVLLATKGMTLNEKIESLATLGFSFREIAEIVGTSANYVNVALYRLKKKKNKK